MTSFWNHDPFLDRLQQHAGSPWTLFEAQQQLDALVLQPRPLSFDSPWADPTQFLDFLTPIAHRRLLHCFLSPQSGQQWTFEALLKQTRPSSPQALSEALHQCCFWQIALEDLATHTWQGHPRLITLNNFGWTFEWMIQALLERNYSALVRRHVILGEIRDLGEIDLLAFLANGQSLLVECKSSSKGLTDRQLDRFIAKGRGFPADRALLLIDTDDPHQMQQRMGQVGLAMQRAFGDASVGAIQHHAGSSVVCMHNSLYIADTGGGIVTTLQTVMTGTLGHP
jgi:hypothetical protein